MTKKIALSSILLLVVLALPFQTDASKLPSAKLTAVHQRMLNDPANLDLLYEYAQAAVRDGNFEAAIGALEGMLVIAGNQPRVLLELGVLYQRLGAPKVAQTYLLGAQEVSGPGSEIAALAEEYLYRFKKQDSPQQLTGLIRFGLRYQTNPTLSPEVDEILSGGFNVPLPAARQKESDTNALLLSRLDHRYRLKPRTTLASELIFYGTLYDRNTQLNYGLLELTSGPLFESPMNADGQFGVQPHLILRGSTLDSSMFEQTAGLGINFKYTPGADTWLIPRFKVKYQYRDIDYKDFNDHGTAPLRSGGEHRLDMRYYTEYMRGHLIELGLFGRLKEAERKYLELDQYDITLRYSLKLDNFFQARPRMSLTPYVLHRVTDYGGPDPEIDPTITRSDREWRLGLTYRLPLTPSSSLLLDLEHTEADSNIVNYDFNNNLFMISFQKDF